MAKKFISGAEQARKNTHSFRITRPGAQHRRKEDGEWRTYGYGEVIKLPYSATTDQKYNNLSLVIDSGDIITRTEEPAKPNPAPEEAKGEKGDDRAEIESLIAELEDSSGNAEFQKAREKVIEADLFEADTVPTKKADLLQALIDLRDGADDAEDGE